MKVKTMLYASIIVSLIAFLVAGTVCLVAINRINREGANVRRTADLSRDVFEANLIIDQYLIYREQRPLVQWQAHADRLSGRFQQMQFLRLMVPDHQQFHDHP